MLADWKVIGQCRRHACVIKQYASCAGALLVHFAKLTVFFPFRRTYNQSLVFCCFFLQILSEFLIFNCNRNSCRPIGAVIKLLFTSFAYIRSLNRAGDIVPLAAVYQSLHTVFNALKVVWLPDIPILYATLVPSIQRNEPPLKLSPIQALPDCRGFTNKL